MSSGASAARAGASPSPVKAKPKKRVTIQKPKKESSKVSHPPTATMVNSAIVNLKERGGSSTKAIKKYVSSTYKIDGEKAGPLIRKYLKVAAEKGLLTRTKGKGASGSFKIHSNSPVKGAVASPATSAAKKPRAVIKVKKPQAPKKTKVAKPKRARKTPTKVKKSAKKTTKPRAKKVVKKRVAKK